MKKNKLSVAIVGAGMGGLTLAAALIIVAFGAGRWSIDGAIYSARPKSKETIDG